jgi:hypothetical protein
MAALAPATTYEYRVGDAALGVSAVFNFSTMPLNAGSAARPLKVLQIADMGYGPNSDATVTALTERVEAGEVDFIVHPGDVSYADADEAHWDDFGRKIQPIAARVPYMTGVGDHEAWWNFTAYKAREWMPAPGFGAPADALYYSFEAGPVAFVMMDSETWFDTPDIDKVQQAWVGGRLAEANAAKRFIVTMQHRPLYCSGTKRRCSEESGYLRGQVEGALLAHRVGLDIAGHQHNYERSFPAAADKRVATNYTDPAAPVYIVNGAAGNREGHRGYGRHIKKWSAARHEVFGYLDLSFAGGDADSMTVTGTFRLATNHSVVDQFELTKQL